jgi:hypothetical protein
VSGPWWRRQRRREGRHAAGRAPATGATPAEGLPRLGTVDHRQPHQFAEDAASRSGAWCACGKHRDDRVHGGRGE